MALSLNKEALRHYIERAAHDLPALSPVLAKIIDLTEKSDATASELDKLISTDPALAARLLRAVNSAYYGLSNQVGTIQHAIVILGFRQVRNIVLSMAAMSLLSARGPGAMRLRHRFWRHSFGASTAVGFLAEREKVSALDRDRASVGALLHAIGVLFLHSSFPDIYTKTFVAAETDAIPLEEAELAFMGITHQEIGGILLNAWKFPEYLVTLVRDHHGPFDGPIGPDLALVHAADFVSNSTGYTLADTSFSPVHPQIAEAFGLDRIDGAIEAVKAKVEGAESLFGLL